MAIWRVLRRIVRYPTRAPTMPHSPASWPSLGMRDALIISTAQMETLTQETNDKLRVNGTLAVTHARRTRQGQQLHTDPCCCCCCFRPYRVLVQRFTAGGAFRSLPRPWTG